MVMPPSLDQKAPSHLRSSTSHANYICTMYRFVVANALPPIPHTRNNTRPPSPPTQGQRKPLRRATPQQSYFSETKNVLSASRNHLRKYTSHVVHPALQQMFRVRKNYLQVNATVPSFFGASVCSRACAHPHLLHTFHRPKPE